MQVMWIWMCKQPSTAWSCTLQQQCGTVCTTACIRKFLLRLLFFSIQVTVKCAVVFHMYDDHIKEATDGAWHRKHGINQHALIC